MKDTAPSMEEIKAVKDLFDTLSFRELNAMGIFKDNRKMVITKTMTGLLLSHADESSKEKIWKLCKKLAVYTHAPVTLKEYQRMKPYSGDREIVDVVLNALSENHYPFSDGKNKIEPIQGYYYCIAILSQSAYNRDAILTLLQKIADYLKRNMPDAVPVLKRNMDTLKADHPDLAEIRFH